MKRAEKHLTFMHICNDVQHWHLSKWTRTLSYLLKTHQHRKVVHISYTILLVLQKMHRNPNTFLAFWFSADWLLSARKNMTYGLSYCHLWIWTHEGTLGPVICCIWMDNSHINDKVHQVLIFFPTFIYSSSCFIKITLQFSEPLQCNEQNISGQTRSTQKAQTS